MTRICFIRHGETDWNLAKRIQGSTDIPLNETGRNQAEQCAAYLNAADYDVLIHSPLKRAKETAEIINAKLQLPMVEMTDFQERSFGDGEGKTYAEREKHPDGFPNQEERADFNKRVITAVEHVQQNYPDKRVLLVAHGAVINAILSVYSDGEIGSGKTTLLNACISNLHFEGDMWRIEDFNRVKHLS